MGTNAPLSDMSEEKIMDFETAVMPIPQFDPKAPQMISQGPSVCIFNKSDPQEVLASWLFAQYLLTDEVQIAYAQTEGYVPVTTKARQSQAYQDYLSRSGEDNALHYDVKIKATKLLLENVDHTFVTPVFNGSASLRDAAGQLIEETVKSIRRSQTVDDAYYGKLYEDLNARYHLDQLSRQDGSTQKEKADLGPLPRPAILLLAGLAVAWALMLFYVLFEKTKQRK